MYLIMIFFLVGCVEEFMENARLLIFETFCRIHHCITIDMLAEKLNMDPEDAERWIVNLIRNASLDAKIDSQQGTVVMGSQALSPYQIIIEKNEKIYLIEHKCSHKIVNENEIRIRIGLTIKHNNPNHTVVLFHCPIKYYRYFYSCCCCYYYLFYRTTSLIKVI